MSTTEKFKMQNFSFKTRKMMNQATAELYYTTNYVEDYFDCIESLPNDLQRNVSQIREVDSTFRCKFAVA